MRTLPATCLALGLAVATVAVAFANLGHRQPLLMIFASASLAEALQELADTFGTDIPEMKVSVHASGTPMLVLQVHQGAGCDVFASADPLQMQRLAAMNKTADDPLEFAHNKLAIVTAEGNPHAIAGLADLTADGLSVALCGPQVPAGRYARLALEKAGVVVASVSDEPSVSAILSKVKLGQIDAGIVYASDADRALPLHTVAIREEHNVTTSCWIAPITTGNHRLRGAEFVDFVRSPEGQSILSSYGFTAL